MAPFGDATRAVNHMNEDHKESVVAWAHFYLKVDQGVTDVVLTDCTREGFHVSVEGTQCVIRYPDECKCESASVTFTLRSADLAVADAAGARVLTPGEEFVVAFSDGGANEATTRVVLTGAPATVERSVL